MSTPAIITTDQLRSTAQALEKEAKRLKGLADKMDAAAHHHEQIPKQRQALKKRGDKIAAAADYRKSQIAKAIVATGPHPATIPAETLTHYAEKAIADETARIAAARDREALRLARRGYTNAEIADQLNVSTKTISRAITAQFRTPKRA